MFCFVPDNLSQILIPPSDRRFQVVDYSATQFNKIVKTSGDGNFQFSMGNKFLKTLNLSTIWCWPPSYKLVNVGKKKPLKSPVTSSLHLPETLDWWFQFVLPSVFFLQIYVQYVYIYMHTYIYI